MGKPALAFLLHLAQECIIVIRVVVRDRQHFYTGHFSHLQRLFVAAVPPASPAFQLGAGVLRFVNQQIRALGKLDDVAIDIVAMLDIRANDQNFSLPFHAQAVRAAGMVVPVGGDFGERAMVAVKIFAIFIEVQKFKAGAHAIQSYRKIFRLHCGGKNSSQIRDLTASAERENIDFLARIERRRKERKALNMIPMKVRETNENFILVMPGGDKRFAQISDAGSGVDDRDPSRIRKADLETRGVPAKFLKFGITNRDRAAGSVKFNFHAPLPYQDILV